MRRYNAGVTFKPASPLLLTLVLLAGGTLACNRAPENKDAVREGVMEHLNKNSGLDLKSMDVAVGDVTFQGNEATASVSFKPKSSPEAGMSMNYKLERRGDKWVVQPKATSGSGHSTGMPGTPPPDPGAHAPGSTPPPAAAGEALPPGHPPVAPDGAKKGGAAPAGDLPPGHPPVSAPKTK
jgi:hypothetical protein